MTVTKFDNFLNCRYFTIRCSNRYWSGIWTDITIEQVLMRSMKSSGGLTHGRGITDSIVLKWILSSIIVSEVSNEMEKFCNVSYSTSEQHVDTSASRINRDLSDLSKLVNFFSNYHPFPNSNVISSIYSGIVGNESLSLSLWSLSLIHI